MIRYILICFGWFCGPSEKAKTIKNKVHLHISSSSEINLSISEPKVIHVDSDESLSVIEIHTPLPINESRDFDLSGSSSLQSSVSDLNEGSKFCNSTQSLVSIIDLEGISGDNVISLDPSSPIVIRTSTPTTSRNNLPRNRSVKNLLRDSGLSMPQLIKGYSYCDHVPGQLIDINLDHGTCCRRYENGVVVTESIETLECCLATIDENEN